MKTVDMAPPYIYILKILKIIDFEPSYIYGYMTVHHCTIRKLSDSVLVSRYPEIVDCYRTLKSQLLSHNSIKIRKYTIRALQNITICENRPNSDRERSKWKTSIFKRKFEIVSFPWFSWYYQLSTRVLRSRLLSLIVGRYRTTVGCYHAEVPNLKAHEQGCSDASEHQKFQESTQ